MRQRVRSVLTQRVNQVEGRKLSIHVGILKATSSQLRFSGLNLDCIQSPTREGALNACVHAAGGELGGGAVE